MKGCIFLTAADAGHGIGLAGFRQLVTDPANLAAEFEKIVRSGEAGLVIIDERLLAGTDTGRIRALEKNFGGALVVLPSPDAQLEGGAADYGSRLIARVLGYQIKLS